jgi:hypothetical protein
MRANRKSLAAPESNTGAYGGARVHFRRPDQGASQHAIETVMEQQHNDKTIRASAVLRKCPGRSQSKPRRSECNSAGPIVPRKPGRRRAHAPASCREDRAVVSPPPVSRRQTTVLRNRIRTGRRPAWKTCPCESGEGLFRHAAVLFSGDRYDGGSGKRTAIEVQGAS